MNQAIQSVYYNCLISRDGNLTQDWTVCVGNDDATHTPPSHALLLGITFQPMSFFKFFALMTAVFNEADKQQGADAASELSEIKICH